MAVAIPVVIYLLSLYALYVQRDDGPLRRFGIPTTAVLILVVSFAEQSVLLTGLLLAGLVAIKEAARIRGNGPSPAQDHF
jgi:hypothetical protein